MLEWHYNHFDGHLLLKVLLISWDKRGFSRFTFSNRTKRRVHNILCRMIACKVICFAHLIIIFNSTRSKIYANKYYVNLSRLIITLRLHIQFFTKCIFNKYIMALAQSAGWQLWVSSETNSEPRYLWKAWPSLSKMQATSGWYSFLILAQIDLCTPHFLGI